MDWNTIPEVRGAPNFDNLLAVLQRQVPARPTLYEFFLNERLYTFFEPNWPRPLDAQQRAEALIRAFARAGYDHAGLTIPNFSFSGELVQRKRDRSVSLNEGSVLHTRADFDAFPWPDVEQADFDVLARLEPSLPGKMKLIPHGPNGVLENVVDLVGYEDLCLLIHDDPQLADNIFEAVGTRLVRYYQRAARYDSVGACMINDDWGFKTQTMFAPRYMRRFVFPWHQRIVEVVHAAGKPAILHSCGHFQRVIEDVIGNGAESNAGAADAASGVVPIGFDARHSYEDGIMPVEEFYDRYHQRIAVLGGIDLDFVCRATPEEVYQRAKAMLQRSASDGGYALGTGNSVPDYVPDAQYFAMVRAALEER